VTGFFKRLRVVYAHGLLHLSVSRAFELRWLETVRSQNTCSIIWDNEQGWFFSKPAR